MLKVWAAHGWLAQKHPERAPEWLLIEWAKDTGKPVKEKEAKDAEEETVESVRPAKTPAAYFLCYFPIISITSTTEMIMGFKKTSRSMDFADFALANCLEQNRSIKLMDQLSNTINWSRVKSILLSHCTVGTSEEGARAYPPLMLFKCLLLQKWFRIQSDPELENQINDRLSFKTFLGLAFSQPAPDHSTFSRFRGRLPKAAMDAINSEILRQFEHQGLSINEGVAVDARLVKSASRPLSNDELKKQRDHRQTEEGQRDKNAKPLKFSRDLESDWVIKNDTPHFGRRAH